MLVPFSLLALNLGAAIAVHARFRADIWLLMFHLALLALLLLIAVARLTYFEGFALVTRGLWFEGRMNQSAAGPLHGDRYRQLRFMNAGFVERPVDGAYGGGLMNRVVWQSGDRDGVPQQADITDDRPLILDGYRIYPATARGFSPFLVWTPDHGAPERGTIQLRPPGDGEFPHGSSWRLADGREWWAAVKPLSKIEAPLSDRPNLGVDGLAHTLLVWSGDSRFELRLGESARVAGGRLDYEALETWVGYNVIYDPTRPWLIAVVAIGALSLATYYVRRLRDRDPARFE
jgi:cytochrome c biogenesis protein